MPGLHKVKLLIVVLSIFYIGGCKETVINPPVEGNISITTVDKISHEPVAGTKLSTIPVSGMNETDEYGTVTIKKITGKYKIT